MGQSQSATVRDRAQTPIDDRSLDYLASLPDDEYNDMFALRVHVITDSSLQINNRKEAISNVLTDSSVNAATVNTPLATMATVNAVPVTITIPTDVPAVIPTDTNTADVDSPRGEIVYRTYYHECEGLDWENMTSKFEEGKPRGSVCTYYVPTAAASYAITRVIGDSRIYICDLDHPLKILCYDTAVSLDTLLQSAHENLRY